MCHGFYLHTPRLPTALASLLNLDYTIQEPVDSCALLKCNIVCDAAGVRKACLCPDTMALLYLLIGCATFPPSLVFSSLE